MTKSMEITRQNFSIPYYQQHQVFPHTYISNLQTQVLACPYLALNILSNYFVETKGFSVVFRRSALGKVKKHFPFFKSYLELALRPKCNAFYLNLLLLKEGSRVQAHTDHSLASYCETIEHPIIVSILYVKIPANLQGGELLLHYSSNQVFQICPQENTMLYFEGNLTHSVNTVNSPGERISLVCEQYSLSEALQQIPEFTIQSSTIN